MSIKAQARADQDATIFVALAAYREPELRLTIDDCIAKAANPERLRFGICLQYDNAGPAEIQKDCIDDLLDDPRFKVLKYDYRTGKGGCWARHLTQTLFRWERYTLQVDAHTRFVDNWDIVLIDMLHGLPSEKPIITGFPPLYWRDNGHEIFQYSDDLSKVGTTVIESWNSDGAIHHPTPYIAENQKTPRRTRVISGAFVFTLGHWIQKVTQDPQSLFWGEEFALTLRSFTNGFDLFNPTQIVVWHRNHPEANPKYITDFPSDIVQERHKQAMDRLQLLMAGDPLGKLGVFSLGRARSLYDYYIFSGLDCRNQSIHPDAFNGVPPDPVTIR